MSQRRNVVLVSNFCTKRALEESSEDDHESIDWSHVPDPNIEHGIKATHPPSSSTSRTNKWRSLKRKRQGDERKDVGCILNANVAAKRLHVDASAATFGFCRTIWMGLTHSLEEKKMEGNSALSLRELQSLYLSLKVQRWNGRHSMKIVDKDGRVIVHLGGRPRAKSFRRDMKDLDREMDAARLNAGLPDTLESAALRGDHPTGTYGYTYPAAKGRPVLLKNGSDKGHLAALAFASSKAANRVKGIQASMMKAAAPRMYDLYCETDRFVRENALGLEDELRSAFPFIDPPGCYPFASVTYNFGTRTVCRRHRDCKNFAPGWCAVTSVGNYNPRNGGHLVLWELGLIVEFPPGATILLPSALITHFNTTVGPNETRKSIVRYSAGCIFLWAARTREQDGPTRAIFADHLQLYMTMDELVEQCNVFQS